MAKPLFLLEEKVGFESTVIRNENFIKLTLFYHISGSYANIREHPLRQEFHFFRYNQLNPAQSSYILGKFRESFGFSRLLVPQI